MKPIRKRQSLLGALLALALLAGTMAQALPVVEGDVEDLFALTTDDCPDCTATELAELEAGFSLILGEMRAASRNPDAAICVVNASLVRDLALLTFELRRNGAITSDRWRDDLTVRSRLAGTVSEAVWRPVLDSLLEQIGKEFHQEYAPDSIMADQIRIHTAIQIHRLSLLLGVGFWDRDSWWSWLSKTDGSHNSLIDALIRVTGPARQRMDQVIMSSRQHLMWLETQRALLTNLPEELLLDDIPEQLEQLRADYETATINNQSVVMWFGCGTEAAAAFRHAAFVISEGYELVFMGMPIGRDQDVDPVNNQDTPILDEIIILGRSPDPLPPRPVNGPPEQPPIVYPSDPRQPAQGGGVITVLPPPPPTIRDILKPLLDPPEEAVPGGCDPTIESCEPKPNCMFNEDGIQLPFFIPCDEVVGICWLADACDAFGEWADEWGIRFETDLLIFSVDNCVAINRFCKSFPDPYRLR